MHTFSAKHVTVAYRGGARAIREFDLDFKGNCLAVVGGEKDGKTTLVNALSGLVNYEGEFVLDGRVLSKKPEGDTMQSVLEDYCLLKHKTVQENVEFPLKIRNLDLSPAKIAISEFGLDGFKETRADKIPEKIKPYVAAARLSLVKRDMYVFDDFLRPLDGVDKELFLRKLKDVIGRFGAMTVYVTHDMEEARFLADKIAIIYGGVIEQYGTYDEIKENPLSKRVAEYFDKTVDFRLSVLKEVSGRLSFRYGDDVVLQEDATARLIDGRYVGKEVLVAPYKADGVSKYLILDASTEKTILKY